MSGIIGARLSGVLFMVQPPAPFYSSQCFARFFARYCFRSHMRRFLICASSFPSKRCRCRHAACLSAGVIGTWFSGFLQSLGGISSSPLEIIDLSFASFRAFSCGECSEVSSGV